jgi:hypothetical protein
MDKENKNIELEIRATTKRLQNEKEKVNIYINA